MLSCDEQAELAIAVCATAEALGHVLSANAAELIAEDLAEYEQADIAAALKMCRRELSTKLTLSAILQRIHASDGRPEANEAWAIALSSFDEQETVLLTPEIQQACAVAMPIFQQRDKVGARMAFIAAYERLVAAARSAATPSTWSLSLGHDQQRRVQAIESAQRLGRLTAPAAQTLLLQHTNHQPTGDGAAIAGLITGKAAPSSQHAREKLQAIRDDLAAARRRKKVTQDWERRRLLREEMASLRESKAKQAEKMTASEEATRG